MQYRMPTFGPDTRNTKRRILASETTHRHIWCLLNSVTASVLDPSRLAIVNQVEIGPCLSLASYEDTIYTGGTTGTVSAYDGTTCKRLRSREVSKHPITAIVAGSKFVWVAVSNDDQHGTNSILICLDAQTLQEETRHLHPTEETITSLSITPAVAPTASNAYYGSNNSLVPQILWTGGYSGAIQTFKVNPSFENSDTISIQPLANFAGQHKTRILNFLWNGDYLYSCSNDAVVAWKPDSSSQVSQLSVPTNDIASFTVLEKSAVITGHRNGSVTVWASL